MSSIIKRYKGSYFACVMAFVWLYFAMAVFSSVLSVYLTDIGKSASEMSFIVSASGIFSFFVVPLAGYFTDRTQNPKAISSILLLAAGLMGLAFARAVRVGPVPSGRADPLSSSTPSCPSANAWRAAASSATAPCGSGALPATRWGPRLPGLPWTTLPTPLSSSCC